MRIFPTAAKRWFWFAVKLAVSLALLAWLFRNFGLTAEALTPVSYPPLVAGLAAACVQPILAAVRWHVLLRLYALNFPFRETARIQYAALFAQQFLPGFVGGDAV